jgi:DNA-binding NarL/FixJ family response regulator
MTIRLAIVDGHTLTRFGVRQLIVQHADIEIVGECSSAAEARALVSQVRPEVVTIDTVLPDGDGLRLSREFRDRDPRLGIVVLTSHRESDMLFLAMEAGASAFVPKTAPVEEVLGAIRHAAVAASSFTATGLAEALTRRRAAQERLALSPREMEVLVLLRDGLSVPAIAAAMFIGQSTAKTYVARLYYKLGATNRTQALMTAMHHGLLRFGQGPGDDAEPVAGDPGPEAAVVSADSHPARLGQRGHDGDGAASWRPRGQAAADSTGRHMVMVARGRVAGAGGERHVLEVLVR